MQVAKTTVKSYSAEETGLAAVKWKAESVWKGWSVTGYFYNSTLGTLVFGAAIAILKL